MGWIEKKVGKNLGSEQKSSKKCEKPGKWTKGVRALSDKHQSIPACIPLQIIRENQKNFLIK